MALVAAVAVLIASGLQAAPAQADNCQAEELVTKQVFPSNHPLYESPAGDESSDPRCIVLKGVGCDNASNPGGCASGILAFTRDTALRVYCSVNDGPICWYSPPPP